MTDITLDVTAREDALRLAPSGIDLSESIDSRSCLTCEIDKVLLAGPLSATATWASRLGCVNGGAIRRVADTIAGTAGSGEAAKRVVMGIEPAASPGASDADFASAAAFSGDVGEKPASGRFSCVVRKAEPIQAGLPIFLRQLDQRELGQPTQDAFLHLGGERDGTAMQAFCLTLIAPLITVASTTDSRVAPVLLERPRFPSSSKRSPVRARSIACFE